MKTRTWGWLDYYYQVEVAWVLSREEQKELISAGRVGGNDDADAEGVAGEDDGNAAAGNDDGDGNGNEVGGDGVSPTGSSVIS